MSCDQSPHQGINTSLMAVIDNNLTDVLSISYGGSELSFAASDYTFYDGLYSQAAAQGESIFVSSGDSGSDVNDQNTTTWATSGINVSGLSASPLVTAAGGTDLSDTYDAGSGGPAVSKYWNSTNTTYYQNAISYVPETAWNDSCASSLLAASNGYQGAGLCGQGVVDVTGSVVGGSGGFSSHYSVPAYQSNIPGYAGTKRAQPDIAGFASSGFWGHALLFCDSNNFGSTCDPGIGLFGAAGGTSFVAPYMAGVAGLLKTYTGARQGLLNPALYALAKAQFSSPSGSTGCLANGQTGNAGVTKGLPGASCVFNDVTTSNNDVPCVTGDSGCYVDSGNVFGILSVTGASSLQVAYPSTPAYDEATGIGSVNVYNLLTNWNKAFTSSVVLTASLTTIAPAGSTSLTAKVTAGLPPGSTGESATLSGLVSFASGTVSLGSCGLSAGQCSLTVQGSALKAGANAITATYQGSHSYPTAVSSALTVTVELGSKTQTITFAALPNVSYGAAPITLTATASSGLPVSYAVTGPVSLSGSVLTVTGVGPVAVTAAQTGNATYAPATSVVQKFTVLPAAVVVTANSTSRLHGTANPVFAYTISGLLSGDGPSVISGTAVATTSATSASATGTYPITFSTESLKAANYTFSYVNGTLTVK